MKEKKIFFGGRKNFWRKKERRHILLLPFFLHTSNNNNVSHSYSHIVKLVDEWLPGGDGRGPIHALVGVPMTPDESLHDVEHEAGLGEDEHTVTLALPELQQGLHHRHLA